MGELLGEGTRELLQIQGQFDWGSLQDHSLRGYATFCSLLVSQEKSPVLCVLARQ